MRFSSIVGSKGQTRFGSSLSFAHRNPTCCTETSCTVLFLRTRPQFLQGQSDESPSQRLEGSFEEDLAPEDECSQVPAHLGIGGPISTGLVVLDAHPGFCCLLATGRIALPPALALESGPFFYGDTRA